MNCEREPVLTGKSELSDIVRRIDMMARELAELRQMVENAFREQRSSDLTSELLGCLGSEPLDDYDYSLDWERFGADDRHA
ncbi:MAG: hypothetical protein P4L55_21835 [Syntrophobacteraceae bacterium]|nr:hypothetical protein [Syntrophobacteraceae bacterium]